MSGPFDDPSADGGNGFGYSGSRADAIATGRLYDVSELAAAAGFKWHVALTRDAWNECVQWSDQDSENQVHQSERMRLIEVLRVCARAIRLEDPDRARMDFSVARIPRDGVSTRAAQVQLQIVAHLGDDDKPVLTILLPPVD